MKVPAVVTADVFHAALDAAERVGESETISGLGAPLGAALRARVSEVWDRIRHALRVAYEYGVERAVEARDKANAAVDDALGALGPESADFQAALLARLRRFADTIVRGALAQVDASIDVGGRQMALADVTVARHFRIGGSLKASITELVALTADGEMQVQARYQA